jgi:hypothetical protein
LAGKNASTDVAAARVDPAGSAGWGHTGSAVAGAVFTAVFDVCVGYGAWRRPGEGVVVRWRLGGAAASRRGRQSSDSKNALRKDEFLSSSAPRGSAAARAGWGDVGGAGGGLGRSSFFRLCSFGAFHS